MERTIDEIEKAGATLPDAPPAPDVPMPRFPDVPRLDAPPPRENTRNVPLQYVVRVGVLGFDLVIAILAGGFLGYAVDFFAGTKPWGMVAGISIGLVVGFIRMVRAALRVIREG